MRGGRKNTIYLGMLSIPVTLTSVADGTKELRTATVAPSGEKAKRVYMDPATEEILGGDDLRRGVERGDGFAIIPDDTWDAIAESTKLDGAEIIGFLDEVELLARSERVRDAHYVQPQVGAGKALALLRQAMDDARKAAVLTFSAGSRQRLGLLRVRPSDRALELLTLASAAEVREPDAEVLSVTAGVDEGRELDMARQLVEQMGADPEILDAWRDELIDRRNELIERAATGEEIEVEAPVSPPAVEADLLVALARTIAERAPTG